MASMKFEGGNGVHYFAKRTEDFRDKHVVIVGGGDSAVDWANTLKPIAKSVRVVHRSKFRAHEHAMQQMIEAASISITPATGSTRSTAMGAYGSDLLSPERRATSRWSPAMS